MALLVSLFKTTTRQESPLDASGGTDPQTAISDFLTIQSLMNFAAMTGAITAAWRGLQLLHSQWFSGVWVPFAFAAIWGFVSILISLKGLRKIGENKFDSGSVLGALFIAVINSLVLASAVVGANSK